MTAGWPPEYCPSHSVCRGDLCVCACVCMVNEYPGMCIHEGAQKQLSCHLCVHYLRDVFLSRHWGLCAASSWSPVVEAKNNNNKVSYFNFCSDDN